MTATLKNVDKKNMEERVRKGKKSDEKAIGKTHSTKKQPQAQRGKGKKAIANFRPRITFFTDTFRAFFSNDTRKFMANT